MRNVGDVYKELQRIMPSVDVVVPPIPAATTVLWKKPSSLDAGEGDVELYLTRRAPTMRFLPGFWTFPGGKQDLKDDGPKATALRELAEETGVTTTREKLQFAGRWITPEISPMRFDSRFYLVELPEGQVPDFSKSGGEAVDARWMSPQAALLEFERGQLLVTAPMLRLFEALAPGLSGAAHRAEQASLSRRVVRLWPIAGGIAVSHLRSPTLPPANRTNCFVVGSKELIIIDPATPHASEREAICGELDLRVASGQTIVAIWLTHHHADHMAAAEFLADRYEVPICAHAGTAQLLKGICRVDRHLKDSERWVLAGPQRRELECILTPGHAPGHLCFLERETGWMMVGDMLSSVGTILIDPSEGDMADYLDSLRRIRARKARILAPAHGFAIGDPESAIDQYLAHRQMREDKVLAALSAEAESVEGLVSQVYNDTPAILHGLAGRSLLSHLLKLETEGRAGKDDQGWRAV